MTFAKKIILLNWVKHDFIALINMCITITHQIWTIKHPLLLHIACVCVVVEVCVYTDWTGGVCLFIHPCVCQLLYNHVFFHYIKPFLSYFDKICLVCMNRMSTTDSWCCLGVLAIIDAGNDLLSVLCKCTQSSELNQFWLIVNWTHISV